MKGLISINKVIFLQASMKKRLKTEGRDVENVSNTKKQK